MNSNRERWAVIVAYFLIYVVWGSTYYFIGVALQGFPTFLLGTLRFSIAGLLLLGICAWRGKNLGNSKLMRRSAVSGIVLLFIDMAVIMLAQRYVSSSVVAIVASSTAIWIMLLDVKAWKRNFCSGTMLLGMFMGFIGVGLLYCEYLALEDAYFNGGYGMLILMGGCISWALGTLYAKYRSSGAETVNEFAGSAWQMIFASCMFAICTLATGEYNDVKWGDIHASSWLSLVYLIIFGSLLAYSAYVWLLKVRPAAEVATHAYVNPVVAVVIGGVGGEEITLIQLLGLVVIVGSVALVNHNKS